MMKLALAFNYLKLSRLTAMYFISTLPVHSSTDLLAWFKKKMKKALLQSRSASPVRTAGLDLAGLIDCWSQVFVVGVNHEPK